MNTTSRQHPSAIPSFARFVRFATSCLALFSLSTFHLFAAPPAEKSRESSESTVSNPAGIKIGIVISSTDAETVWNAFRFASFALKKGDSVKVFLLAKGVDCQKLDSKDFKITEQMQSVVDAGGKILACGTCLKLRQSEGTELCPLSTMQDMYDIIKESDKVLTF
jgi:uncharacterized protein involved in oxidation of intracellular sulfur